METKRFFVAADIHGSMMALNEVIEIANKNYCDKILLLGDTFGVNATEMVEKLNDVSNRLTIVKGNNDWYYELPENAKFMLFEQTYENINGVTAFLCHGHRLNDMMLDGYGAKLILQGHVHRPFIEKSHGVIRVCPGSIASPRFGSKKSYAIIDDKKVKIFSVDGDLIDEVFYQN